METLPFVSLIIWSTGLCTLGLLGLSISDMFAERRRTRSRISQQRSLNLQAPAAGAGKPATAPVHEQLLKAA
ncbi:hypothetical protein [Solimonas terrae]|uniref:Heme exporter protein D n=1 Tax=Solimonas terrae TaxID=1396819 RepID=A0A6M2BPT4_9GAMM|nr:hypothetical protein [Solimonas terrae]NGY04622.1 hypothetical protein [Solimonas terrae]